MFEILLFGIFAADVVKVLHLSNVPMLELARTPFAINLGILGAFLVPRLMQAQVRDGLIMLSLLSLVIMTGVLFAGVVISACFVVFLLARLLHFTAKKFQKPGWSLVVGWGVINAFYLPISYITFPPFEGYMAWGEIVLFWGPAFLVLRALHYTHQCCKGRVDPNAEGAFRRFLLYLIHFPSFWFGPYQRFRDFDSEVDTCKERITPENRKEGIKRILIGVAKFVVIFHVFNILALYQYGFYGPFSEELFRKSIYYDASLNWIMIYAFMLRIMLFISALSDGVIGMNLLMGIRMGENSNWPVFSRDILEFWRRWHIQAGVFLREEVFFPMRGLRKPILGFFCVFAYSGLWHFPSISAVLYFAVFQVLLIKLTMMWIAFWKAHDKQGDAVSKIGKRFYLHNSWPSACVGMLFVGHTNVVSVVLIHDHVYGGSRILPSLLGLN